MQQYRDMLNLTYVKRWVITDNRREISVAEHSYRVAVIAMAILDRYRDSNPDKRIDGDWVVRACLSHDVEEVYTGDIPGPDKDKTKAWADPTTMTAGEIVVKLADIIETWTWGMMYVSSPLTRLDAFDPSYNGRDIRKMVHYTNQWPAMREAVQGAVKELFHVALKLEGE